MSCEFDFDKEKFGLEHYQKDYADMIEGRLRMDELRRNRWMAPLSFIISVLALIVTLIVAFIK